MGKLLTYLLLFMSICAMGQNDIHFEQLTKATFTDGLNTGALYKFRHVFHDNPLEYKMWKRYNRTRNTQKVVNFSLLGLVGIVAIADFTYNTNCSGFDCPGVATGAAAISAGFTMLLFNAVINPIKVHKRKKLIKFHFDPQKQDMSINNIKNNLRINTKIHQSGLVMTLNF